MTKYHPEFLEKAYCFRSHVLGLSLRKVAQSTGFFLYQRPVGAKEYIRALACASPALAGDSKCSIPNSLGAKRLHREVLSFASAP